MPNSGMAGATGKPDLSSGYSGTTGGCSIGGGGPRAGLKAKGWVRVRQALAGCDSIHKYLCNSLLPENKTFET